MHVIETGMGPNLNVLNAAPKYTLYYNEKYIKLILKLIKLNIFKQ